MHTLPSCGTGAPYKRSFAPNSSALQFPDRINDVSFACCAWKKARSAAAQISSSIAAHIGNAVAEPHDYGTIAQVSTPRTARSTSDGISSMCLDDLMGGELPMCAAPIAASRLTLESDNKLGSGAFSVVLEGVLDNRQPVAVKRLHGYYFEENSRLPIACRSPTTLPSLPLPQWLTLTPVVRSVRYSHVDGCR